jgi:hypothetical protein
LIKLIEFIGKRNDPFKKRAGLGSGEKKAKTIGKEIEKLRRWEGGRQWNSASGLSEL